MNSELYIEIKVNCGYWLNLQEPANQKTVTAEGKKCVSHQTLHLSLIRKNSKLLGLIEITNNILLIVFLLK